MLCEKPLTLSWEDSYQVVEASQKSQVLLTEALWSRFNPVYKRIRELIQGPDGLKPASVMTNFTDQIFTDRIAKPQLGGGAMYDIGIYCLQIASMVFGSAPVRVAAAGSLNEFGVDSSESVSLQYRNGGHASLLVDCRGGTPDACGARIFFKPGGTYTSAKLGAPFWAPSELELTKPNGETVTESYPIFPNASKGDGLSFNFVNSQALAYEAEAFADAFEKWQQSKVALGESTVVIEHPLRTHQESLDDAKVIDEVMKQIRGQPVGV